jgi:uncharacterized protein (TIGR00251 family)
LSAARLELKVVPRAARSEIVGWLGNRLKLRVAAVPEAGRANAAITAFLASELGVPKSRLRIVSGRGAQHKTIEIAGLDADELAARLPAK